MFPLYFLRPSNFSISERGLLPLWWEILSAVAIRDHPFKMSARLRGEGCPHVPMVKRSKYVRIKNPLHKRFAGMPMVGGVGVNNRENLPFETS